ncbi:hypothetical protein [Streptomyces sp. NPDC020141]|uniref:hypothetical protein n=1 Tax=Streptomyces sp. NPDC020141 TaxID=3365065 RepID=UPI0037A6B623
MGVSCRFVGVCGRCGGAAGACRFQVYGQVQRGPPGARGRPQTPDGLEGIGPRSLGPRHRTALVWIAAAAFLGLALVLAWQARRAQSVVSPDATTLTALAALAVAVAAAVTAVFLRARASRPARPDAPG